MRKFFIISLLALTLFSGVIPTISLEVKIAHADARDDAYKQIDYAVNQNIITYAEGQSLHNRVAARGDGNFADFQDMVAKINTYKSGGPVAPPGGGSTPTGGGTAPGGATIGSTGLGSTAAANEGNLCWNGENSQTFFGCFPQQYLIGAFNFTLLIVGKLMKFVADLFDYVVNLSLTQFDKWVGGPDSFVTAGWRIVRDICNFFFIFILLYTAIRTVIGLEGDTKRVVLRVVLMALLMNFSLPATKLVIDAGNVSALYFYNAARGGANGRLSDKIVNITRIVPRSQIVGEVEARDRDPKNPGELFKTTADYAKFSVMSVLVKGFTGIFFFVAVLLILIAAAGMFAVRLVHLIWRLITAPWPFLYYAFEGKLSGSAGDWLSGLVEQSFMAPVFFILFYLALTVAGALNSSSLSPLQTAGPLAGLQGEVLTGVQDFLGFFIVMCFMIACLRGAQLLTGGAGSGAAAWADKAIHNTAAKAGAWAGRNTLGRGAAAVAENRFVKATTSRIPGGMALQGVLDRSADAKFGGKKGFIATTEQAAKDKAAFYGRIGKDKRTGEKDERGGIAGTTIGDVKASQAAFRKDLVQGGYISRAAKSAGAMALGALGGSAVGGIPGAIVGAAAGFKYDTSSRSGAMAEKKIGNTAEKIKDLDKEIDDLKKELEKAEGDDVDRIKGEITRLNSRRNGLQKELEKEKGGGGTGTPREVSRTPAGETTRTPRAESSSAVAGAIGSWRQAMKNSLASTGNVFGQVKREAQEVATAVTSPKAYVDSFGREERLEADISRFNKQIEDLGKRRPTNDEVMISATAKEQQREIDAELASMRADVAAAEQELERLKSEPGARGEAESTGPEAREPGASETSLPT